MPKCGSRCISCLIKFGSLRIGGVVSKSEAEAHLANYTDQKNVLDTNMVLWAAVVDYEENKEKEE